MFKTPSLIHYHRKKKRKKKIKDSEIRKSCNLMMSALGDSWGQKNR